MRLVVEIQAVADQLFELDFGRSFGTPAVKAARPMGSTAIAAGTISARPATIAAGTIAAIRTWTTIAAGSAAAATRSAPARGAFTAAAGALGAAARAFAAGCGGFFRLWLLCLLLVRHRILRTTEPRR